MKSGLTQEGGLSPVVMERYEGEWVSQNKVILPRLNSWMTPKTFLTWYVSNRKTYVIIMLPIYSAWWITLTRENSPVQTQGHNVTRILFSVLVSPYSAYFEQLKIICVTSDNLLKINCKTILLLQMFLLQLLERYIT